MKQLNCGGRQRCLLLFVESSFAMELAISKWFREKKITEKDAWKLNATNESDEDMKEENLWIEK